jgi:succinyl-diaminopimelate desuccinylase
VSRFTALTPFSTDGKQGHARRKGRNMSRTKRGALIVAALDTLRPELIRITSDLVRFKTLQMTGENFWECAEYLSGEFARVGLDAEVLPVPEEELAPLNAPESHYRALGLSEDLTPRYNVLARLAGSGDGHSLHINGHYDVVEPPGKWSADPFIPRERDGAIVGRGTVDMKGGLAATIVALMGLHEAGVRVRGDVFASATIDTHFGGNLGAGYLARNGLGRADRVIVTDTSGPTRMLLGYRGQLWMEVIVTGAASHASTPFFGVDPVEPMAMILVGLKELRESLQSRISESPVVPEEARRPSLTFGARMSSTDQCNLLPGQVRFGIDRRLLPEETLESAEAEIAAVMDRVQQEFPSVGIELRRLFGAPPTVAATDDPLVRTISTHIEEVTGTTPQLLVHPGFFDLQWFTTAWGVAGVVYGPGDGGAGTGFKRKPYGEPDEQILVADLLSSSKVLALSIADLTA